MKIRRTLATAVAVALTSPVVLLAAAPAMAAPALLPASALASAPASPLADKPTDAEIEKLAQAVADAKKAFEAAVLAKAAAEAAVEAAVSDTAPHALAVAAAKKEAEAAGTARTAADKALADAKAALEALDETATEQQKADAEKAVAEAATAADAAATAKTEADDKLAKAAQAAADIRVAAFRELHRATEAHKTAYAALVAAEKALADAKKAADGDGGDEGTCVDADISTAVIGMPTKVAAGSTVNFSLRLTNDSKETMDKVHAFATVYASDKNGDKDLDHLLKLQWSTAASPKWQNFDRDGRTASLGSLANGKHTDVKLRLTVDAKAPAGEGVALAAGDFVNDDGTCGEAPGLEVEEFEITAAPGKPGGGTKPGTTVPVTSNPTPQGGTSTQVVTTTAKGQLASTGSDSALPQLALAGGAAVALGAGAMFVVRRRAAGSGA
ncbi:peptidase [Streptomyces sp. NPDC047928]|uniref:peptidase n=1 Tax=unclassified Streptomyces TaxID=2593676 RepID=UPI0037105405